MGVGAGIIMYICKEPSHYLQYKLHKHCSNNQAEQFAILKALEKLEDTDILPETEKSVAIHTDSQVSLDLLRKPHDRQN